MMLIPEASSKYDFQRDAQYGIGASGFFYVQHFQHCFNQLYLGCCAWCEFRSVQLECKNLRGLFSSELGVWFSNIQ